MSSSDGGRSSALAPAPKRLRVSRACEQCRAKKIKCDGSQPTCRPCGALAVACSYGSAPPKKRGLAPGSVSALERSVKLLQRVLGLLLLSVESADRALLALVLDNAGLLLFDDSEDGGRQLTRAWKAGCVAQALDALRASDVGAGAGAAAGAGAGAGAGGSIGPSGPSGPRSGTPGESHIGCDPTDRFRQACAARFRVEVSLGSCKAENDGDGDKPIASRTLAKNRHHHHHQQQQQHQQQPNSAGRSESGGPVQNRTKRDHSEGDVDRPGPDDVMDGDRPLDDMGRDRPEDSKGLFGMGMGMGMDTGLGDGGIVGRGSRSLASSHHFQHPFSPPPPPPLQLPPPPPDASSASSAGTPSASLLPPYSAIYIPRSELTSPSPAPHPASTLKVPELHQQQGDRLQQQTAEIASIPPNARLLLDIYFSYSHAWFPILDKYDIVRLLHTINAPSISSPSPLPPPPPLPPPLQASSLGKRALLYALLALSSAQHEGVAAAKQQRAKDGFLSSSASTSTALYMSAQQLLFASTEYDLEHVQTLLLLSLASIAQLQLSTAWLLVGLAGRIATDIGLNVPSGPPFARRTWMGYLALESLVALWTGRQPLVADSDWDVAPVAEDGWEEWDEWKGVPAVEAPPSQPFPHDAAPEPAHVASAFNQLVSLCRIVRRIASQQPSNSSSSSSSRHPDDLELQRTVLLQQLHAWARHLPHAFALTPLASPPPPSPPPPPSHPAPSKPHTLNLHLLYLHALLRLHQAPLLAVTAPDRMDEPSRATKEAAVASTEALLVAFRAQRSLAVAPGPFVHYTAAAAAAFDDPLASGGTARAAPRVAMLFSDDLTALCAAQGTGFEPGRALLRSVLLPSPSLPPPPPKPGTSPAAISSPRKRDSSPLLAFARPSTARTSEAMLMQDFYSASPTAATAAAAAAAAAASCSPSPSMGTALLQPSRQPASLSLREEDLNASNIATSASAAFPLFHQQHQQHHQQQQQQQQQQPTICSDTFDDEFGMFDLPWFVARIVCDAYIPYTFPTNASVVGHTMAYRSLCRTWATSASARTPARPWT